MHKLFITERGDLRGGHEALIFRVKFGSRRKNSEKLAYDIRVPVHFQKNSWVETEVVIELARELAAHARAKNVDL